MKTYTDFTELELVLLLKNRDHFAFTEIYNRYAMLLFYKVNQMIRDEEIAKDIIQDLFTGLWEKSDLIQENNNLSGYLYIIARNAVLKYIQFSKIKNDYISSLAHYASDVSLDTLQDIGERELQDVIQKEIEKLPSKMKVIFEMSRNDNLTHAQIAERLGISDKTVKKQVQNALKRLKDNLSTIAPIGIIIIELAKRN